MAFIVVAFLVGVLAYKIFVTWVFAPVDRHGAQVSDLIIHSDAVGEGQHIGVVVPNHGGSRSLLVLLHGRNETIGTYTEGDEPFFEALSQLGARAPVVAFPEDDGSSYWHNRETGAWGTYLIREVIPELVRHYGVDSSRVAIGGISMGGFGAYNLALQHPSRFCAVGGHSAALWFQGGETAPGAFDDAEDFERNDVIGEIRADPYAFGSTPIWNDVGSKDPFYVANIALTEILRNAETPLFSHRWPGGHERAYWDRHWYAYLSFYSRALSRCH